MIFAIVHGSSWFIFSTIAVLLDRCRCIFFVLTVVYVGNEEWSAGKRSADHWLGTAAERPEGIDCIVPASAYRFDDKIADWTIGCGPWQLGRVILVIAHTSGCWSTAPHAVILTLTREHYYCVYRLMYWSMLLIYNNSFPLVSSESVMFRRWCKLKVGLASPLIP